MNLKKIGDCANLVWKLISGSNRKWEYEELKEATGLSNRYLNAAIGWLASQNKIQFEKEEDRYYNVMNYYIG